MLLPSPLAATGNPFVAEPHRMSITTIAKAQWLKTCGSAPLSGTRTLQQNSERS
jgi:hypothetical protein